jgi:hypothetical protein
MTIHRVLNKSVKVSGQDMVDIKYWADGSRIYVAGFDQADQMVTATTYSGEVSLADEFYDKLRESLIDRLVSIAESDLLTNPQLHYRPR